MSYDQNQHAFEIAGRMYICVRCSDLDRDGMYLELSEIAGAETRNAMEIFYSDVTGGMTMRLFQDAVPLPAVEWMIASAKEWLPPINKPETDEKQ
jgi:hypothetical protein